MNEEFAIRLKMVMDESSFARIKEQMAKMGEEVSNGVHIPTPHAVQMFDLEEPLEYTARINLLLYKIRELQSAIASGKDAFTTDFDILSMQAELEKLVEEYNKLIERQKEAQGNKNGTGLLAMSKTVVSIKNDMDGVGKKTLQLSTALLGVSGIYGSIRKAMATYLSQNSELQQKINACWYALGSLFAPVLEWIVNLFVKLVSIVDAFVKLLGFAGVNMANYGKQAGKASKQLAGFDEINNLSENGGGGSANPFGNFDLADKFGEFSALIKGNAEILKLIGIGAMFGIGVALLFTGHPIAGLGMILSAGVLTYQQIVPDWNYIVEKVGGVTNAIMGIIAGFSIGLGAILTFSGHPALGLGLLISGLALASFAIDWSYLPNNILETVSKIMVILGASMTALGFLLLCFPATCGMGLALLVAGLGIGYAGYKLNTTFLSDAVGETLGNAQTEVDTKMPVLESSISTNWGNIEYDTTKKWGNIGDVIGENLDDIRTTTGSKTGSIWSIFSVFDSNLNRDTTKTWGSIVSTIITKFGDVKDKLKKKWESLEKWWSSLSLGSFNIKLPHLSWGTNSFGMPVVNVDWYAKGGVFSAPQVIGVGEYSGASSNPEVVAPLETLQSYMNNEETNDLLRELIDVVGSKEFRAYISQREIGEASLNYQRSKQRIMGGGLV